MDRPTAWHPALFVVSLLALGSCASASKPAVQAAPPSPTPVLAEREDLPVEAREILSSRMLRHGDQMGAMTLAVVLLDYEVVRLLAARMIDEPVLGRPMAGDKHSLNALLPKSFFVHQDALSDASRALAEAAAGKDDLKLVAAFNDVTKSCVGCHSAYLHEELTTELGIPCEIEGSCDEEVEPEPWRDDDL